LVEEHGDMSFDYLNNEFNTVLKDQHIEMPIEGRATELKNVDTHMEDFSDVKPLQPQV